MNKIYRFCDCLTIYRKTSIIYHFLRGTSYLSLYLLVPNMIASASHQANEVRAKAMTMHIITNPVPPSLNPTLMIESFPRTKRAMGITKTKSLKVPIKFCPILKCPIPILRSNSQRNPVN